MTWMMEDDFRKTAWRWGQREAEIACYSSCYWRKGRANQLKMCKSLSRQHGGNSKTRNIKPKDMNIGVVEQCSPAATGKPKVREKKKKKLVTGWIWSYRLPWPMEQTKQRCPGEMAAANVCLWHAGGTWKEIKLSRRERMGWRGKGGVDSFWHWDGIQRTERLKGLKCWFNGRVKDRAEVCKGFWEFRMARKFAEGDVQEHSEAEWIKSLMP